MSMISKTAEYALRATVLLASGGSADPMALSADQISDKTQVPRRYLHHVLQDLVTAGIVSSRPGPGGGYSLGISADMITLLDVVNACGPLQRITECPLGIPSHTGLCPVHAALDEAIARTEDAFRSVTVASLLASTSPFVPLCAAPD